jgi:hypothetical protein
MIGDTYTIPLTNAWLCVSCNRIGSDASQCPFCASKLGLLSLVGILDRQNTAINPSVSGEMSK